MKYLFTLLATCFVLGLSAQNAASSADIKFTDKKVTKLIDAEIESLQNDLAAQNTLLLQNDRLTEDDKVSLKRTLTLTDQQIETIKSGLLANGKALKDLENSDIGALEIKERKAGLEAERNHIIYQALSPQQQTAFKNAKK